MIRTCLFALCLLALNGAQAADKPNILVIWGDDIGISNISAYNLGMMGYQTPNIDRIAKAPDNTTKHQHSWPHHGVDMQSS